MFLDMSFINDVRLIRGFMCVVPQPGQESIVSVITVAVSELGWPIIGITKKFLYHASPVET